MPTTKRKAPVRQRARKRGDVLTRDVDLRVDDINEEDRSVAVSFASETDTVRGWSGSKEILLHEDGAANFSGLRSVLFNHDPNVIVGRAEGVAIDTKDRKARATIVFDDDPESERIFQKVTKSGSLRGVSVGFRVDRWQVLGPKETWKSPEGRQFTGPADIATKWRPIEFSLTPIPADATVGVGRSESTEEFSMDPKLKAALVRRGLKEDATDEEAQAFIIQLAEEKRDSADPTPPPKPKDAPKEEKREEADPARIRQQELDRVRAIIDLGEWSGKKELARSLVDSQKSVEDARKAILDEIMKDRKPLMPETRVDFGEEEITKWSRAAEDSLIMRVGGLRGDQDGTRLAAAREVGCFNLVDLARECCRRKNIPISGLTVDKLVIRAMSHSTSDFPSILENVMNKQLQGAWSEAQSTYEPFVRFVSASDFKAMSRVKLGDSGDLLETPELVPMPEGSFAEKKESYAIATYSRRFGISRQAIINDDLSAFDDIPRLHGAAARRLPNQLFYDLLVSASGVGPTMAEDSKALFATDHPSGENYKTGAFAIDVANLGTAKKFMRLQKGLAATGETAPTLNIIPTYLLVPAALENVALQAVTQITPAQISNVAPAWIRSLSVVVEPRLDAATNGTTAWYLVASPASIPTAEMAFLNGTREPSVIREPGTNVLGIELGVYLDCGVHFIDHRGFYRAKGA